MKEEVKTYDIKEENIKKMLIFLSQEEKIDLKLLKKYTKDDNIRYSNGK